MPEARSAFPLALARLGRKKRRKTFCAGSTYVCDTAKYHSRRVILIHFFFSFSHPQSKLSGSLPRPLCSTFPPPQLKRPSKRPYYTWFLLTLGPVVKYHSRESYTISFLGDGKFFPTFLENFHWLSPHVTGHRLRPCFIFNKVLAAVGKDRLVWIRVYVSCYEYSVSVIIQRSICMLLHTVPEKLATTLKINAYIQGSSSQAPA